MILNSKTIRLGNKVEISASPQFMKVDGVWRPIDIQIEFKNHGYHIHLSPGASISISPADTTTRNAIEEARTANIIEDRYFGPLIDTKVLAVDKLHWKVETAGRVSRWGGDYIFDEIEGANLGLSLRDWRRKFKFTQDGDDIELDFTSLRADPDVGVVNLDPEVELDDIASTSLYRAAGGYGTKEDAWAAAREFPTGIVSVSNGTYRFLGQVGPWACQITRCLDGFNVAGYENAIQAILRLGTDAISGGETNLRAVQVFNVTSPVTTGSNFNDIYDASTDQGGTAVTLTAVEVAEPATADYWESTDLVAAGLFDTDTEGSTIYYGVMDDKDDSDTVTEGTQGDLLEGLYGHTLILTLPAVPGSTSTATTTTRRSF